jgi:nucleotide-binding universal stress UspA family protein
MSVISSKILVPIGFSNQSLIAFDQACNFAKLNHSKIFLLSVIEERNAMHSLFLDDNSHKLKKMVLHKLTELSQEFAKKYSLEIEIMVSQGKIHNQINEVAEMIGADLIIMGTTGSSQEKTKRFMGSNAERVIRLATCPVMTIKGATIKGACRNIILPLDLEKETKEKVTYAIKYSRQWNATIHLISVVLRDNPIVRNKLVRNLKQVESFIKDADISCTSILLEGDKKQNLGDFIFDYEKKFDDDVIIIMTKKEELSLSRNISVTARYIINNSPIPVINIRPKERKHLTGPTTAF